MASERVRWPTVVDRTRQIVESYEGGVTLRQVMYRLVSARVLPHTPSMYRRLSSRLARARREGRFPDLVDTLREVHVPPAWPDAGAFLGEAVDWFALDRTRGQEYALYVAAEKDTLRQLLTGWLAEYGIPVLVVRGFGSQSYVDIVRERTARDPRPAHLLYVGISTARARTSNATGCSAPDAGAGSNGCWSPGTRSSSTSCPRPRARAATPAGPASPAATTSILPARCSGRPKP